MRVRQIKNEVWKQVPDYEGYYEVSNYGVVRGVDRVVVVNQGGGYERTCVGRVLKIAVTKIGYKVVALYTLGNKRVFLVHRLVLEAFVGPCPDGMEACHNDGDKLNNCLANLRWDTVKNNHHDKKIHGTHIFGERHSQAKLTYEIVDRMKKEYSVGGITQKDLAVKYNISHSVVNRIINNKAWINNEGQ